MTSSDGAPAAGTGSASPWFVTVRPPDRSTRACGGIVTESLASGTVKRSIHLWVVSTLDSIAGMETPLGAGYRASACCGRTPPTPHRVAARRSCRPRPTWWWSARGYCGLVGGAGAGPPRPVGGRARRARPRVGSEHAQRRHGAARAEGRPALARANARGARPAPARGGGGRLRPRGARSIADGAIDCAYERTGQLYLSHGERSSAHLDELGRRADVGRVARPRRARATTLARRDRLDAVRGRPRGGAQRRPPPRPVPRRPHPARGRAPAPSLHPRTPATAVDAPRRCGGG